MKVKSFFKQQYIIALLCFLFFPLFLMAQQPFITTWNTTNSGNNNDRSIYFRGFGEYNYYWENVEDPNINGTGTEENDNVFIFPTPGTYRLEITPTGQNPFHRVKVNAVDTNDYTYIKITSIDQWGDVAWSSMESAFSLCYALENIFATDIPDFSNLESLGSMFMGTKVETIPNVNNWDVSTVTNMNRLFTLSKFNDDIGNWDVSNVTSMYAMFESTPFNQPIGNWNVENVTNMRQMFTRTPFNQPIENWDVSNVTSMDEMFDDSSFNQPIGNWNVSNVKYMGSMFAYTSFNQPIGNWDVSNVTNMRTMFYSSSFNQPIGDWDVSNVTNMSAMFTYSPFNQPIGDWDVSNVTNMSAMFNNSAFNQPIENWDVSNVENLGEMFRGSSFNQTLGNWKLNNITNVPDYYNELASLEDMFRSSGLSCENYSSTLFGWANNPNLAENLTLGASFIEYSPMIASYRDYLINDLGWVITGDSEGDCQVGFTSIWDTEDGNFAPESQIIFPGHGSYIYHWENINDSSINGEGSGSGYELIEFPEQGKYRLSVFADYNDPFHRIEINNYADRSKLISIEEWGLIQWSSFENAFYGADNLEINATDIPNLNEVSSFKDAFRQTNIDILENLEQWDMSHVQNMQGMFRETPEFNQSLEDWNLKEVEDITHMLSDSGLSCENYSMTLLGWATHPDTPYGLELGADGLSYSPEMVQYRDYLLNDLGWTINGDTQGNCFLGLDNLNQNTSIVIYPNPAKEHFTIDGLKGAESIFLYDNAGKLVKQEMNNKVKSTINISNLSSGVYHLVVKDSNGQTTKKQLIKK